MNSTIHCVFASIAIATFGGCSSLPKPRETEDVAEQREERHEHSIDSFERRRNLAEYEAAEARLREGDHDRGLQMLSAILVREPAHQQARLLLADTLLVDKDVAGAERQLVELVNHHPNDAQAHHSIGLLLESTGRSLEATAAFARAVELEPTNELYRLSLGR